MENLLYDNLILREKQFEGDGEIALESDLMVPDYLPEVMKILRVDATPQIGETTCRNGAVTLEGSAEICVMYLPGDGKRMKCLRHTVPFEKTFEIAAATETSVVLSSVSNKLINCKLLTSKKMNFSLGLLAHLSVSCEKEQKHLKEQEVSGLEMRCAVKKQSCYVGSGQANFNLEEELELGSGKPAALSLLKCDVRMGGQQAKLIANKVITKATAYLHFLYESCDNTLETADFEIPVSHILDLQGVDDDCICQLSYDVVNRDFSLMEQFDGETRIFSTSVELCAHAAAYRNQEVSFVEDAYPTKWETDLQKQQIVLEALCPEQTTEVSVKDTLVLENGVTCILDTVVSTFLPEVKREGKRLSVHSTADVFLLIRNGEGDLENVEKQLPIQFVLDLEELGQETDARFVLEIAEVDCRMAGADTIAIKLSMLAKGTIWQKEKVTLIADLEVKPDCPLPGKKHTLVLYYPDNQEPFWDIAKRYGANMQRVKEINGCEGDICTAEMLLIPRN